MKIAAVFALSVLLFGCTCLEVHQQSTAELRGRFAQDERELASYHPEETDQATLRRFVHLTDEQHSIEHELFRRCRAGDQNACLPHFHLIAADL